MAKGLPPSLAREKALDRARLILPIVEACESEGKLSFRELAECLNKKVLKLQEARPGIVGLFKP